ncbi:MAG TPA: UDP-N-acetylglucosamine 2-epimerase (non-hydrolyzing) [Candidatus Saccharimonadales bacterium]|nr:UDP-N-acetylglucosamine 2-epimerase (non-hydrolyzing) [Candidatus Saccharimonadales bacterium]
MLLISYGTRPEWLKVKPVIEELKKRNLPFFTLFTGQHEHLVEGNSADYRLTIPKEYYVDRLNKILFEVIAGTGALLHESSQIKWVMVQGDTTSALGVALAAFNAGRKVVHLEAGLRTHDLESPYPEEGNRQLISRIAQIHFCPTHTNFINLMNEGKNHYNEKFVVGNTALDNLLNYKERCEYQDKVLVTLHRRENHATIEKWFKSINELAKQFPETEFILPIHPNPNVQKHRHLLTAVKVIDPLPHEELLEILIKCKLVITDSGGLQEEASFFNKKVLVCRDETERPEAVGITSFMSGDPNVITELYHYHVVDSSPEVEQDECPFGDGNAAKQIVDVLLDLVYDQAY